MALITLGDAMSILRHHSHTATITEDGLMTTTWVKDCNADHDDSWYEETMVFPINADNTVESKAIRNWLGY